MRIQTVVPVPGDLLLGVAPGVALALLVVNDTWLKGRGPALLTGKLSDFAGLFLLPLILVSFLEVVRWFLRRRWLASKVAIGFTCWVVAVGFLCVKTMSSMALAYGFGIGVLRWPVLALTSVLHGVTPAAPTPIDVVVDSTDLAALTAVFASYLYARRRRDLNPASD